MDSKIDYAARLKFLLTKVSGESLAVENGWEIPREPARFLALELSDSEPIWAINSENLQNLVRELNESETSRTSINVWDLDTGKQHRPIIEITGFTGAQSSPISNPLTDASNLATILAALRLFQRTYDGHEAEDIYEAFPEHFEPADGKQPLPLGSEDIDALCEQLNFGDGIAPAAAPPLTPTLPAPATVPTCPECGKHEVIIHVDAYANYALQGWDKDGEIVANFDAPDSVDTFDDRRILCKGCDFESQFSDGSEFQPK